MSPSPITIGVGNGARPRPIPITPAQGVAPPAQGQPSRARQAEFVICDQTIELGFRALKGLGWQWQRSRRTDPARVARHWLALAVASLWAPAHGTRRGRAERRLPPARLRAPPASRAGTRPRRVSLVRPGIQRLRHLLARGRLWHRLRLAPEPWPQPPPGLAITVHGQGA